MRRNTALAFVAGVAIPLSAIAGQIGITVTVAGQQPTTTFRQVTNGQDIEIDLQTITGATDVHVFDVLTNDSEDSLGMITLRGNNAGNHIVRVAIATTSLASVDDAFDNPANELGFGLKNLGGFQVLPSSGGVDPRDRTAVNICVSGDITGNVTAGRLFRVETQRLQGASTGGTISGNLRATAPDGQWSSSFPTFDFKAIGQVWAGWQITGDIIADGAATFSVNTNTWGSVERIVVNRPAGTGPVPAIGGHIICDKGQIKDIVCPGQIGAEANPIDIVAGVSVGRITLREPGSSGDATVLDENIFANVNASFREVPATTATNGGESVSLIETAGDFRGDVVAYSVHASATPAFEREQGDPGFKRAGIFVGGDFIGDITIAQDYIYHDIIARSFQGKITIGNQFKGALVAVGTEGSTDPLDGTIDEVEIGFTTSRPPEFFPLRPGFSAISHGNMAAPFEGEAREEWYTRPGNNSSTVDGVIRAAKSITVLKIKTVSNRIFGDLVTLAPKDAKARIEAPIIGSLTIDNFDSGAVWSGKLAAAETQDPMADDYASIGSVTIGCMGPMADLWVKDCPLIDVKGDMFGEIHLPVLASGETIRIAGALGDNTGALNKPLCNGSDGQTYGFVDCVVAEDSPRGVWEAVETNALSTPNSVAEYGRIILQEPSSLNGQIIIDATNSTGAHRPDRWTGDIVIGSGTPLTPGVPVVLSTSPIRAQYPTATGPQPESAVAPLYSIPSSVLAGTASGTRGGAVGLVPFARYEADCNPENYRYFEETNHSNAPFLNEDNFVAGAIAAEVAYYGPVFSAGKGLELNRVNRFNPTLLGPVGDTLYTTDAANGNRAKPRVVAVTGNNEVLLGGRFALLPRGTASPTDDLLCDLGPGIAPPLTFEPADSATRFARYDFLLAEPCSQTQCSQCFGDMGFPLNQFCFIADHNNDDGVDGDDVIAFFNDWEASNQNADVNFDNGVDGDDIIVFFCWWDAGGCNAN